MEQFKLCLHFCSMHAKKYIKRIAGIFAVYVLILLFVNWNRVKQGCSYMDLFVLMNGGYSLETNNLIDMLLGIFPYLTIGYICSVYMEEMLKKQAMFVLIRMKNKRLFHLANVVTLSYFNVVVLLGFSIIKFCMSMFFYKNGQIESMYYVADRIENLNIVSLQAKLLVYQIIGNLAILFVQYMIQKKCGNSTSGMLFVFAVYILNIYSPMLKSLELGTYVVIGNLQILCKSGTALLEFVLKNCIYIIVAIVIIMKRGRKKCMQLK